MVMRFFFFVIVVSPVGGKNRMCSLRRTGDAVAEKITEKKLIEFQ